jgi:hypothetical protein
LIDSEVIVESVINVNRGQTRSKCKSLELNPRGFI